MKKLEVDKFENAGSILFRVFVELSVDAFIDSSGLTVKENAKLSAKVKEVAHYMINNSIATKHELKPITTAVADINSIFSINTFNAYVHNQHFAPKAKDLKVTWDNFKVFMEKLWDNV